MNLQLKSGQHSPLPRHQQGVAIITALLIVALATAISVSISTRMQLDIRRTANMITLDQAGYYNQAAEDWSRRILKKDKQNSSIDSLTEDWAIALPPLPVEGGSIQGRLTDLSACININALFDAKTGDVDKTVQKRFERLFTNAGLTNPPTQAILDWIDADLKTRNPDGAEDGYYLNLPQPYRTANTALQSISELRLIKGFENPKVFPALRNNVCAYPDSSVANNINVNTASREVLKSLSAGLTDKLADDIIERRATKPFENLKDFTTFDHLGTIIKNTREISFSSDIFLLRTQAIIGQASLVVYSIIYRDSSGNTKVLARSQRTL